jgi:hypothetical protein
MSTGAGGAAAGLSAHIPVLLRPRIRVPDRLKKAEGTSIYNAVAMTGLSAQVQRNGLTYYVQTQDMGLRANLIESLIYRSGKLLSSRKTVYTPYLDRPDLKEQVARIMQDQHERVVRDINEGKFDRFLAPGER